MKISIPVLAIALALAISPGSADEVTDALDELKDAFNQEPRSIGPTHPLLPVNYLEFEGEHYAYLIPDRLVRLAGDDKHFFIRKIRRKKRSVEVEFHVAGMDRARVKVSFLDNGDLSDSFQLQVLPLLIGDLFDLGPARHGPRYTGNSASLVLHLAACNHLPRAADRQEFVAIEDAIKGGFRKCAACFPDEYALRLPDYAQRRRRAAEGARLHEIAYPPVEEERVQEKVRELGESLLQVYPFELKGYDYRFRVLQSGLPMANAYPTGFVFISEAIFGSVESDAELAFLIAHEITHVELDLLDHIDERAVSTLLQLEELYATRRRHEFAADWIAARMTMELYGREAAFSAAVLALEKLGFAEGVSMQDEAGRWDAHPAMGDRVRFLKPDEMQFFEQEVSFCALNKADDRLVTFTPIAIGYDSEEHFMMVKVDPSDLLNKTIRGIRLSERPFAKVKDSNGTVFLLIAPEDWSIVPGVPDLVRLKLISDDFANTQRPEPFEEMDCARLAGFDSRRIPDTDSWAVCPE